MFTHGHAAKFVLLAAGQAIRASAECAYRVEWLTLDVTDPATLVAPLVDPDAGYRVINPDNPLLYVENEAEWVAPQVNCNATSWRYRLVDGVNGTDPIYATSMTFPNDNGTEVGHENLFMAQGTRLLIDSYPIEKAVAISDTLFGRKIEVGLTCDQEYFVSEEEACVVFKLNFTNSSPEPDAELLESALYRFEEPAVPGFILPAAGNWAPEEDVWLNVDNPIRDIDGSVTETGCNGEVSEYLGEDGEWYFYYTGQDGATFNLTHVFYATEQDRVNIAKIQAPWSPYLEMALFNRTVRMEIYCNNINNRQTGYVLFKIGDGREEFDITLDEYEFILTGNGATSFFGGLGGGRGRGGSAWLLSAWLLSSVAAFVFSLVVTAAP
eukprot:g13805.t1